MGLTLCGLSYHWMLIVCKTLHKALEMRWPERQWRTTVLLTDLLNLDAF